MTHVVKEPALRPIAGAICSLARTGILLFVVLELPSCPYRFPPQQKVVPVPDSAQLWLLPLLTEMKPLPNPCTSTGVVLEVLVPFPSFPPSLLPQHLTAPPWVTAQPWAEPRLMEMTVPSRPLKRTGTVES